VQREPDVLLAVKRRVDQQRESGQFILTGSANLLLMRRVSETLAGRASYLTLWPMTRRERLGLGRAGIWDELLAARDRDWLDLVDSQKVPREDWRQAVRKGGYPIPALEIKDSPGQAIWFDGYTRTYLERDLQEISAVASLPDLRRLMRFVCLRLGQLMNQADLGRDAAVPQPTVHRWLNLLETSYQLIRLPAYAANRTKRLIKAPKLYWADSALALFLSGMHEPNGSYFENVILGDLLAWRDARLERADIFYWRTAIGQEVDFVIEAGTKLLPIEVKAAERPRIDDLKNMKIFQEEYSDLCRPGLLLHTGERVEWLTPRILACPWWKVL
jgi:predicted AAA+ superfamily ATPase